jgi:hypothetical protein
MSVTSHVIAAGTNPTTTASATMVSGSVTPANRTITSVTAPATPPVSAGRRSGSEATMQETLTPGIYSEKVPEGSRHRLGEDEGWREVASSNRERINNLENEVKLLRQRQHDMATDLAVVRYLGDKVAELGQDVKELTEELHVSVRNVSSKVQEVAETAMARPAFGPVSSWVAVVIAIVAVIVAATHG